MKQVKKQQGFTLIELMIVVAIVAILAAIALPFYADFTVRARMSEVAAGIDACKLEVSDYVEAEGVLPTDACAAFQPTQYVTSMTYAAGVVTGTSTLAIGSMIAFAGIVFGSAMTMTIQYYKLVYEEEATFTKAFISSLCDMKMLPNGMRKLEAV